MGSINWQVSLLVSIRHNFSKSDYLIVALLKGAFCEHLVGEVKGYGRQLSILTMLNGGHLVEQVADQF